MTQVTLTMHCQSAPVLPLRSSEGETLSSRLRLRSTSLGPLGLDLLKGGDLCRTLGKLRNGMGQPG